MNTSEEISAPTIPPHRVKALARNMLIHEYGEPAHQKDKLVDDILATMYDPARWPLTEKERIDCIRKWCEMALRIRQTEKP